MSNQKSIIEAAKTFLYEISDRIANKSLGKKYEKQFLDLIQSLNSLPWDSKPKKEKDGALHSIIGLINGKKVTFNWHMIGRDEDYAKYFGATVDGKLLGPKYRDFGFGLVDEKDLIQDLKDFESAISLAKKL